MANLPEGLQGPGLTESLTPSEKSRGNVTNEDLQTTMIAILRSMAKISLETKGGVSRLCSLTGNPQRRLDLEYSTQKMIMSEKWRAWPALWRSQLCLFFLWLRKRRVRWRTKKNPKLVSRCWKKKPKLPNALLFSLDDSGQCGPKIKQLLEESQADIMVNASPFIHAPVNMINLTWEEKGKGKAIWEVKAEKGQVIG